MEGEITFIDAEKNQMDINGQSIYADNISKYEIGQKVKVTLIDTTSQDDWDPEDFKVKEIVVIDLNEER
ncbi:hypothetical protein [Paenibacillus soyae]|uniref:Uncharacterized protein n=1 Tax=Paenibacillus soyae TaxID=2969249 RepID=A0A9X2MU02_9BACL|nr:hypothetical protein [Paenibacillus soyae]MCR2805833.1 hypothetical protein [Paenibacillus soyae]